MIIVNAINGKEKRIVGEEAIRKFIQPYSNAKDVFLNLLFWHNKGEKVFWCSNPKSAELEHKEEILIGLDMEDLKETFYLLSEEI